MYPHYHTHISTSSNTCIHFIEYIFHITIYVYSINQIRTFALSHTCFHITKSAFPPPFRVCLRICGHDKSDPYSCERIAIMLLTVCNNAANKLQYTHVHPRNTILSHHKNHTFAPQKPYFYTTNTILSHRKNLSATNWEGRKNVLLKSSL